MRAEAQIEIELNFPSRRRQAHSAWKRRLSVPLKKKIPIVPAMN